jgi:hypothetical protein
MEDNVKETFQVSGGTVTGRQHLRPFGIKNNQDAFTWDVGKDAFVAVVCDGCGSHPHSEVGAKLGSKMIAKSVMDLVGRNLAGIHQESFWQRVRDDVLMNIRFNARNMGNSLSTVVNEYFLFTVMGVLVTEQQTVVFGIGDGVYAVNGSIFTVGPFPNNAPPYLGYGITGSLAFAKPEMLQFQLHQALATESVSSILIGSDGVTDLISAEQRLLPGRNEPAGPLSQFWTEDRYFQNEDMVRRRLSLINHEVQAVNWQGQKLEKFPGLLQDDTTLVVARRTPSAEEK